MVEDKNIIDVDFEENQYYTLEDVVNITGLSEAKISFYCSKLKDFLNIQSIGMYQVFSSIDIQNLSKIKRLENEEGLNIGQIKDRLRKGSQEILLKKDNDKIDVSFFQVLEKILKAQDEKIDQMINVNKQLIEVLNNNNQSNIKLLESSTKIQENIEETISKTIDSKMEYIVSNLSKEIKSSYVTKEEIERLGKKRRLFGLFK